MTDKIKGVIFGQAIGDALGLGTEYMSTKEVKINYPNGLFDYSQFIQDPHRCRWAKGDWTDDTDMMICIANAIIEDNGIVDYLHIARNFKSWYTNCPMGIGRYTFNVLCLADYVQYPFRAAEIIWALNKKRSAANGAVMRTSVIGLLPNEVEKHAENVSLLTHADRRCVGSSVIISMMIHNFVYKSQELTYEEIINIANRYDNRISPFISIARDAKNIEDLELDGIDMGYTLKTLSAALWSLWHSNSFEEGLLAVVNAGGDADTNGAVSSSLLGAKFGFDRIPESFVHGLTGKDKLFKLSKDITNIIKIAEVKTSNAIYK